MNVASSWNLSWIEFPYIYQMVKKGTFWDSCLQVKQNKIHHISANKNYMKIKNKDVKNYIHSKKA